MMIKTVIPPVILLSAALFTVAVLILGYVLLGPIPMLLFAFGYLGGFALWLIIPSEVQFSAIRAPYYSALAFFVVHKLEERFTDFFPALSKITGVPIPESVSGLGLLLYVFAGAWLLIPLIVRKRHPFGYYLTWTFFASMGVTELAHFVFPFFSGKPYGYFPGMASVVILAPLAWWGMWRLARGISP